VVAVAVAAAVAVAGGGSILGLTPGVELYLEGVAGVDAEDLKEGGAVAGAAPGIIKVRRAVTLAD
jgi:hypothetical protein